MWLDKWQTRITKVVWRVSVVCQGNGVRIKPLGWVVVVVLVACWVACWLLWWVCAIDHSTTGFSIVLNSWQQDCFVTCVGVLNRVYTSPLWGSGLCWDSVLVVNLILISPMPHPPSGKKSLSFSVLIFPHCLTYFTGGFLLHVFMTTVLHSMF